MVPIYLSEKAIMKLYLRKQKIPSNRCIETTISTHSTPAAMHSTPAATYRGLSAVSIFATLIFLITLNAHATNIQWVRLFGGSYEHLLTQPQTTVKGSCFGPSTLVKRDDAWRCQSSQGQVYEPCFAKPNASEAYCFKTPWDNDITIMSLASKLAPNPQPPLDISTSWPWGVLLTNGQKCIAQPGDEGGNMPVHYQCQDGSLLTGPLQRCHMPWSLIKKSVSSMENATIETAWF